MNQYIKHLKKNNYSKNTIVTYKNIIKNYESDFHDIRNIKKKIKSYSKSPNTAWTHYNVLLSYMKFKSDKRFENLRLLKLPPIPSKYMPVFTKAYLLRKTSDLTNYKNVIVRFLFETGIRASELKSIISIASKTIIVKGKGKKIREIFHNNETTKFFKGFNYSTKTLRYMSKRSFRKKVYTFLNSKITCNSYALKGRDSKSCYDAIRSFESRNDI